jgi:PAS domain S-box-containing protein
MKELRRGPASSFSLVVRRRLLPLWRSRPIRYLFACGFLVAITIAVATALTVNNFRERALADTERELKNTALSLADQIERKFEAINLVQASIVEPLRSLGVSTPEDFDRLMSGEDVHHALKHKISGLPYIDAVAVINASGQLINFSRSWPIPSINISDRDRYIQLKSGPQSATLIGEPVLNRATNTWTVHHARRVEGPNGEFLGLIQCAIDLGRLEATFSSLALGETSAIAMFRRDGTLLSRYPRIAGKLGRNFAQGPLFQKLLSRSDHGTLRLNSRIDGQDRLVSARSLKAFPIVVVTAITVAAALTEWRGQVTNLIGMAALSIVLIGALLALIARQILQREQSSRLRLLQEKQRLATSIDNMTQGLLMFDATKRLVTVNRRYIEMYGLSPDVVKPGCAFRDLIIHRRNTGTFSGDVDQYCQQFLSDITAGKSRGRVTQTTDGRFFYIVNRPLPDGGWVSTHDDVTEQRRAEEERDANREFINSIIDHVPVAIIVKNAHDRRVAYVNRETEKLWGISRADAVGKTVYDLFPEDRADLITADDDKATMSDEPLVRDTHQNLASSTDGRILISRKSAIRAPDGTPKYVVSVIEDVTERRNVEAQLRQAQKMEAIGNLTGGVAHDFNNLLTVIIGNLDLVLEETVDQPQTSQKVDAILAAALRGAELTKQMLAFSRRQPLRPKCVDLSALTHRVTKMLSRTLGERIRIDLRASPDACPVMVDEAQLEAGLVNIAINARDAMPDGGILMIETAKVQLCEHDVANRPGLTPGEHVVLTITDTGIGMCADVLGHVFEPFFTTKDTGKGTGLGLSMVYGFVKQSGGYIGVTSSPGSGTKFVLCFPAATAPATEAALSGEQSNANLPSNKVVLAVDDQPDVRATAVGYLKSLGYRVLEADSGKAALDMIAKGARIDLLFTDIVMPDGMNGVELAQLACARLPNLKVLYTSGYPGTELVDGMEMRVDGTFLAKPYRKRELSAAVSEILSAA